MYGNFDTSASDPDNFYMDQDPSFEFDISRFETRITRFYKLYSISDLLIANFLNHKAYYEKIVIRKLNFSAFDW